MATKWARKNGITSFWINRRVVSIFKNSSSEKNLFGIFRIKIHEYQSIWYFASKIQIRNTPEMFIPQTTSPWFTYFNLDWLRCWTLFALYLLLISRSFVRCVFFSILFHVISDVCYNFNTVWNFRNIYTKEYPLTRCLCEIPCETSLTFAYLI